MGLADVLNNNKVTALLDAEETKGFNEFIELLKELVENVPNAEAATFGLRLALNRVPPMMFYPIYQSACVKAMYEHLVIPDDKIGKVTEIMQKLFTMLADTENSDATKMLNKLLIGELQDLLPDAMGVDGRVSLERFDDSMREQAKKADDPLIKLAKIEGITLYHGTSYENYLLIAKDGKIKASDYTGLDYTGYKNLEKIYNKESGFVFVDDAMDTPLGMSFGGYRKNCLQKFSTDYSGHNVNNLAVIFEIDPAQYDVYFTPFKKELVIAGDVDITGLKKHFFIMDDEAQDHFLREITESEAEKKWKEYTAA